MYDEAAIAAMELTIDDLKPRLAGAGSEFELVDVRELMELQFGIIPGSRHIAMSEFELHVNELPRDREIICYCAHGVRSLSVAAYLNSLGYRAKSLSGGFSIWDGPREIPG